MTSRPRDIVFILGAGASAECGSPLMGDFLNKAEEINDDVFGGANQSFVKVFDAIEHLKGTRSKGALDLDNIESVFSAIELANLIGKLGELPIADIEALPHHLRTVIATTLNHRITFDSNGTALWAQAYSNFLNVLGDVITLERCSLLTFNYDTALDASITNRPDYDYSYGLQGEITPTKLPILKLHGSLNWFQCVGECKKVHWFDVRRSHKVVAQLDPTHVRIQCAPEAKNECCGKPVSTDPFIVPPTIGKSSYYGGITSVWRNAAVCLGNARYIFVLGYSYPRTDQFFEYLYALGTMGRTRVKRFAVIDPRSGEVGETFKKLLGPDVVRGFSPLTYHFRDAPSIIADVFRGRL